MPSEQGRAFEDLTDQGLVLAFQRGERDVYDEIYRRYKARVRGTCLRMLHDHQDAEEASQETFLKAYQALWRFNGRYQLGAWLTRIATNVSVDHLRARARTAPVTPLPGDVIETTSDPENMITDHDPRVHAAIGKIQPLHARALELRAVHGLSHHEMAGRLQMTPAQVKALLHRARNSFRRAWQEAGNWALAPVLLVRSLTGRLRGDQLLPVGEGLSPMLGERVAATAVAVALALAAPSSSGPPTRSARPPSTVAQAREGSTKHHADRAKADVARPRVRTAATEVAPDPSPGPPVSVDLPELPKVKDRPRDKKDDDDDDGGGGTVGPAGTQQYVEDVKDKIDEIRPGN